jgi:hypothetical protein
MDNHWGYYVICRMGRLDCPRNHKYSIKFSITATTNCGGTCTRYISSIIPVSELLPETEVAYVLRLGGRVKLELDKKYNILVRFEIIGDIGEEYAGLVSPDCKAMLM